MGTVHPPALLLLDDAPLLELCELWGFCELDVVDP